MDEIWIPTNVRLPKPGVDVLVVYPDWQDKPVQVAHLIAFDDDVPYWELSDGEFNCGLYDITYWMKLPTFEKINEFEAEFSFDPDKDLIKASWYEEKILFRFPYTKEFISVTIHTETADKMHLIKDTLKDFIKKVIHYYR